ncbi:hypothetical protein [Salinicola salarius]|uniref:hypothetical protein n=1 Tax=Salinicola salarius TaxID=430457 RepID=UPI000B3FC53B|nr:hypothetical protein [Salinicola salarius]
MLKCYGFSISDYYNIVKAAMLEKTLEFERVLVFIPCPTPDYLARSRWADPQPGNGRGLRDAETRLITHPGTRRFYITTMEHRARLRQDFQDYRLPDDAGA